MAHLYALLLIATFIAGLICGGLATAAAADLVDYVRASRYYDTY